MHADQTSPANASLASDEIVASHKDADAKRSDGVGPAAEAGGAATESDKSEGGGAEAPHEAAAAPLTNTLTPSLPNEEGPQDASSADERRAAQGEVDIALDDASLVDDVVIADDLAEMLESDGDDGAPEQSAVAPEPALHNKRTIPPPLPRA